MSFDLAALRRAVAAQTRIARIVIAETAGSAPREAGTAMLVWAGGQSGTIGGGALEFTAIATARDLLAAGHGTVARIPLGPGLGQCCGGAVTLVTEVFDARALEKLPGLIAGGICLRPVGGDREAPLSVRRLRAGLRNGTIAPGLRLLDGWLAEPLPVPGHQLWLHGAGHVGRAIVATLSPLPDWHITWIDTAQDRFPAEADTMARVLVAADPVRTVRHAPQDAHHLILTYSHALDLELCHALLGHGFASAGLIGSATKWARFRTRLRQLGHTDASIARIVCPIGDPSLGKHPHAIAVGVVARLLGASQTSREAAMDRPA
ncbi:xanthine dehydrogenase accessory protein XdhC [Tropicimonas sp.]|uniref:xanthine dehydrogenase accessory protein XdhC n=1 Tax=Tropicimonas sp. TaxID=2067044 RepID=UPI003A85D5A8